ncbi:ADP-ribosyl-[dinitrogen reductase] hydrolase [Desulfotomaculum arcticum]|uniref:ADP-ribosyl-[dinitrogen reductase] hydrolase n=1 Tax=Desulfotruncus arcticus DSM 17038 TaxID=1121424 RepID=A0A1I2XWL1_9FIRM|nr:ADP-ribosylglycohydrolase family protein [Desulfotruncus arcticus]SFH17469.1 ADP-ribosyl-[dinitrogen reductase] hydrolase [Desulfotomaculum arcticum] [Desulfotruncus arcticus DSM 17038]
MNDYIQGSFWGAAVGDALGGALENMSGEEIYNRYGTVTEILGGGWLDLHPGEYTDDTQMIIMVAEGILANPVYPIEEIGRRFLRWYYSNPRDIGTTTKRSFENYLRCGSWQEAARMTAKSLNKLDSNGALMRTLPVTFAYWNTPRDMAYWSVDIASMTHQSRESSASCIFYNYLVGKAVCEKGNKRELFTNALRFTDEQCARLDINPKGFFWYVVKAVQSGAAKIIPEGKALDTLGATLQCFLQTDTFEEALVRVINLGGDTDTAGNVMGGLAGAYYGYEAIPERWLSTLRGKERIVGVADAFSAKFTRNFV